MRKKINLVKIGDVYFNSGREPCLVAPTYNILNKNLPIASNKNEARRWLVAKMLLRDIKAKNIVCFDVEKRPTYNILAIKRYRSSLLNQLMYYPEDVTGYFQSAYPVGRRCLSCGQEIGKDRTLRIYKEIKSNV